ncbi:MAG: hypothetical protein ABH864_04310 [archaeon]
MNKRGQFFLIAALVIIGVVFGLSAVYTTIETPSEDSSVYDLTKEINYEAGSVIDSGIFNALTEEQRNEHVENLTDYYASANIGSDLMILFGNRTEMTAIFYTTEDTGSIGVDLGGSEVVTYSGDIRKYNSTFDLNGDDSVTIVLDKGQEEEISFTFHVKPGEMFFIILKKERQGEQFVATSREE